MSIAIEIIRHRFSDQVSPERPYDDPRVTLSINVCAELFRTADQKMT